MTKEDVLQQKLFALKSSIVVNKYILKCHVLNSKRRYGSVACVVFSGRLTGIDVSRV